MQFRVMAERDLGFILETSGDGWPITLTDPDGNVGSFTGMSNDISQVIDPETGIAVSGRSASVSFRIASLKAEGMTMPKAIADTAGKPWLVQFEDVNGESHKFKISQSNPDRGMGLITCMLELYR